MPSVAVYCIFRCSLAQAWARLYVWQPLDGLGARVGWTTTGVEPARAAYKTHSTRRRADEGQTPTELTLVDTWHIPTTLYLRNIVQHHDMYLRKFSNLECLLRNVLYLELLVK